MANDLNNNPYFDSNYVDRSAEIKEAYSSTLQDVKEDPEFYAELVNDLLFHWMYGTRETPLMFLAKKNYEIGQGAPNINVNI